jgi:hypothetical protein
MELIIKLNYLELNIQTIFKNLKKINKSFRLKLNNRKKIEIKFFKLRKKIKKIWIKFKRNKKNYKSKEVISKLSYK